MSLQTRLDSFITAVGADIKLITARLAAVPIQVDSGFVTSVTTVDAGKVIETTASDEVTLTIPPNSAQPFPIGSVIEFTQMGTGQIVFTTGSGVTIHSRGNAYKTAGQYAVAYIRKTATDAWVLTGDLVT